jgi:hypothetical protein
MKVKDLINELQSLDPEMECIIQKDAEGNGYSPLAGADPNGIYIAETTWFGEVYNATWSAEDADMDKDLWEEMLKKPRCVVLFPVN